MSKLDVSKLKSLLQQAANERGKRTSFSFDAAIKAVRDSHPEAIECISRLLQDATMHRYLSQMGERRPRVGDDQLELAFAGYSGLRQWIPVVGEDGQETTEFSLLLKTKLRSIGTWLSAERRSSSTRRQRNPGMAKLLRDLSKAAKGNLDLTVEEAMKLRRGEGE